MIINTTLLHTELEISTNSAIQRKMYHNNQLSVNAK